MKGNSSREDRLSSVCRDGGRSQTGRRTHNPIQPRVPVRGQLVRVVGSRRKGNKSDWITNLGSLASHGVHRRRRGGPSNFRPTRRRDRNVPKASSRYERTSRKLIQGFLNEHVALRMADQNCCPPVAVVVLDRFNDACNQRSSAVGNESEPAAAKETLPPLR